jgi:hypothetical protein
MGVRKVTTGVPGYGGCEVSADALLVIRLRQARSGSDRAATRGAEVSISTVDLENGSPASVWWYLPPRRFSHSQRSAIVGSNLVARRAGT